jgi:hypothetical protein
VRDHVRPRQATATSASRWHAGKATEGSVTEPDSDRRRRRADRRQASGVSGDK